MSTSSLKPGPELDALIAEKVMEWELKPHENKDFWPFFWIMSVPTGRIDGGIGSWSPSTDIAHAWEVVEKVREAWSNFNLHSANGWGASFGDIRMLEPELDDVTERWTPVCNAPTAPHAICLAALKAVGE